MARRIGVCGMSVDRRPRRLATIRPARLRLAGGRCGRGGRAATAAPSRSRRTIRPLGPVPASAVEVDAPLAGDLPHERAGEDPRRRPAAAASAPSLRRRHAAGGAGRGAAGRPAGAAAGAAAAGRRRPGPRRCRRRSRRPRPATAMGSPIAPVSPAAEHEPADHPGLLGGVLDDAPSRSRSPRAGARRRRCLRARRARCAIAASVAPASTLGIRTTDGHQPRPPEAGAHPLEAGDDLLGAGDRRPLEHLRDARARLAAGHPLHGLVEPVEEAALDLVGEPAAVRRAAARPARRSAPRWSS